MVLRQTYNWGRGGGGGCSPAGNMALASLCTCVFTKYCAVYGRKTKVKNCLLPSVEKSYEYLFYQSQRVSSPVHIYTTDARVFRI